MILLFLFLPILILAQSNLVPNPSFEGIKNMTIDTIKGSYYNYSSHYADNVLAWKSPSNSSPDLCILTQNMIKKFQRRHPSQNCDMARTGLNAAGIITYHPNSFAKEYREYLQVELKEPLRPNQRYKLRFWLRKSHTARLVSNNLGVHLSTHEILMPPPHYTPLPVQPFFVVDSLINENGNQWVMIENEFVADKNYNHLLFGNFASNANTKLKKVYATDAIDTYEYAYYLIDDIELFIAGAENMEWVWGEQKIKKGETVVLDNVLFDFDKATLTKESYSIVDKLMVFLKENPTISIEIHGHTDAKGDATFNQKLSEARAKTIADYLIEKGIQPTRIVCKGWGNTKPIADNKKTEGRQLNRRVEFVVFNG